MLSEKVKTALKENVAELGYDLLHLEWHGGRGRGVIKLIIEREGGVSVEDCKRVSKSASALLDLLDPFPQAYSLEVSSPGVQRPIYSPDEYPKFTGHHLYVKTVSADGEPGVLKGELLSASPKAITLSTSAGDVTVPLSTIRTSRLMGPWEEE